MKKLLTLFQFKTLRIKFFVLLVLLVTIPFSISSLFFYQKYNRNLESNANSYSNQLIEQITVILDNKIKEIDRYILMTLYDAKKISILESYSGEYEGFSYVEMDKLTEINFFLSSLLFDRPEIRGSFFFSNSGTLFNSLNAMQIMSWEQGAHEWMDRVIDANGRLVLIPPHSFSIYPNPNEQYFSLARWIKDPVTHKGLGILKVDLTSDFIRDILQTLKLSENSKIFILNDDGDIFYSNFEMKNDDISAHNADVITKIGEDYLTVSSPSEVTDLTITSLISLQDLQKESVSLINFMIILSIIALLVSYVIAIILSNHLAKPIRYLQKKMRAVEHGELKVRANINAKDEMGQLSHGFNRMVGEIERLIDEIHDSNQREKEAKQLAFQVQMNPHFVYNTLELINAMALKNSQHDISDLVSNYGKLLRYTMDFDDKHATLLEEINFAQAYAEIQRVRFQHPVTLDFHHYERHMYCLVPKIILQPLIENALEHGGIRYAPLTIQVSVAQVRDELHITVEDNGEGLTEERKREILQRMNSPADAELAKVKTNLIRQKGFALRNIHQRIRLTYGAPYGLMILDIEQGFKCCVKIPYITSI